MSDFTELTIAGRIATPSDSDWDEARAAWNLVADLRPSAVAFAESAEDVAKIFRFAGKNSLRVSGQSTGHGAVALAHPDGSPLLLAELRQLGGALRRPDERGGALSHLDAEFVMLGIGMPMTPELGQAIKGQLNRFDEELGPWTGEGGYFNFAERPCDADAILPPDTCARLVEVKHRYDPDNTIVANHAVAIAPA